MSDEFLQFSRPSISDEAIQEVVACLKSGWITTGPRVNQFTEDLQAYFQAPHVLPLASATAGVHVSLLAMDIDPHTLNLDMNQLEEAITPRTRVIMPVHFAGLPVDLDPIYDLAKQYNLRVLEDAAHAMG